MGGLVFRDDRTGDGLEEAWGNHHFAKLLRTFMLMLVFFVPVHSGNKSK